MVDATLILDEFTEAAELAVPVGLISLFLLNAFRLALKRSLTDMLDWTFCDEVAAP